MRLGERIRQARQQCGITQEQIAEKMMLSTSAIAGWESNAVLPGVDRLKLLAQLLHVSVDYLLENEAAMDGPAKREQNSLSQNGSTSEGKGDDHLMRPEFSGVETHASQDESSPQETGEEIMFEASQVIFLQDAVHPPLHPCSPGFVQRQPPHGSPYPSQDLQAQPCLQIRPHGKRSFSARTAVFPITFLVLHFLIQLLGTAVAGISYLASGSFASLVDMSPDTTTDLIQELIKAIGIPALLCSTPLQIILYVIFLWYQKRKNRQYLLLHHTHAGVFPLGLVTAFGCLGVTTLLILLFDMLAKYSPFWQSMMVTYQRSTAALQGVDLLLTTLCVAILVPIAEELLFRGIITEEFRQVAPDWLAILLGGIVFALVHGNLVQILYVLPLGFLLGAVYIWTNSIWVPILIHVVFNFFGSIVSTLIGENEPVLMVYTIFLFVMIPAGVFCIFIINRMFRRNIGIQKSLPDLKPY